MTHPPRGRRAALRALLPLALALAAPAADARPVEVPLTLDAPFLRRQLAAHVFSEDGAAGLSAQGARDAYRRYLLERLAGPRGFVEEAVRAR